MVIRQTCVSYYLATCTKRIIITSQNTMYCGGEPEQRHNTYILIAHKHVITKYMHVS